MTVFLSLSPATSAPSPPPRSPGPHPNWILHIQKESEILLSITCPLSSFKHKTPPPISNHSPQDLHLSPLITRQEDLITLHVVYSSASLQFKEQQLGARARHLLVYLKQCFQQALLSTFIRALPWSSTTLDTLKALVFASIEDNTDLGRKGNLDSIRDHIPANDLCRLDYGHFHTMAVKLIRQ